MAKPEKETNGFLVVDWGPQLPKEARAELRKERLNTCYLAILNSEYNRAEIWYFDSNSGREVLILAGLASYLDRLKHVANGWNELIRQKGKRND